MKINEMARHSFESAVKRNKISLGANINKEMVVTLSEEFEELKKAQEKAPSEHVKDLTEVQEELADIALGALTELYRRGADVERVLSMKLEFNQNREKLVSDTN